MQQGAPPAADGKGVYRPRRLAPAPAGTHDAVEAQLQRNALAALKRDPVPTQGVRPAKDSGGDSGLVASMAKRLQVVEHEVKAKTAELQRVLIENEALKCKLKVAEEEIARHAANGGSPASNSGSKGGCSRPQASDPPQPQAPHNFDHRAAAHEAAALLVNLKADNTRLRAQNKLAWKQVEEIKAFLSDYGMVWVGEGAVAPATSIVAAAAAGGSALKGRMLQPQAAPTSSRSSAAPASTQSPWHHQSAPGPGSLQPPALHDQSDLGPILSLGQGLAPPCLAVPGATSAAGTAAPAPGRSSEPGCTPTDREGPRVVSPRELASVQSNPPSPRPLAPRPPSGDQAGPGMAGAGASPLTRHDFRRRSLAGSHSSTGNAAAAAAADGHAAAVGCDSSRAGSACSTSTAAGTSTAKPTTWPGTADQGMWQVPALPSRQLHSNTSGSLLAPLATVAAAPQPNHSPDSNTQHSNPVQPPFSMAEVLARVEELNQLAGDGCGQVVSNGEGAHVLHTPEAVRLQVFRDGIQLHGFPPRPYGDVSTDGVMADVLDGYFPAPLRQEFPDGVPIKVVDRTEESFKDLQLSPLHLGPGSRGQVAGGAQGVRLAGNVRSWQDLEEGRGGRGPVSRDAFLARLPQSVIRDGKVIEVRAGVGKLMGSASQQPLDTPKVALVATPVDSLLSTTQRNHRGPVLPPPSRDGYRPPSQQGPPCPASGTLPPATLSPGAQGPCGSHREQSAAGAVKAGHSTALPAASSTASGALSQQPSLASAPQISTLQVKSEDGQQTMIIKLQYSDTIGALHKYIDAHRSKQQTPGCSLARSSQYEVRTAYPPKAYTDMSETLQAAGLVPNATVFLKALTN